MKRRSLALLLAAALLALLLTACGGGGSITSSAGESGARWEGELAPSASDMDMGFSGSPGMAPAETEAQTETLTEASGRLDNAKLVYTAHLEMETTDFDTAAAALETLTAEMGGYLEYASVNRYSSGYRHGRYTVRVPSQQYKAFLKQAGDIGQVTFQETDTDNISEEYYDIESRLATQRTKLERLQTLLAQAENMADLITIESAIAETELAIEQLTGSLRRYDALVDYSTVHLDLDEVVRLSAVQEAPPGFLSQLGAAFLEGLEHFGQWLESLAILLAYSWLWWLLLAGVVFLALRLAKRRRAQAAARLFGGRAAPRDDGKKTDDNPPQD